jgi:hypothetical protein
MAESDDATRHEKGEESTIPRRELFGEPFARRRRLVAVRGGRARFART